jgi:UDP-glucose-4-epimerase GalE
VFSSTAAVYGEPTYSPLDEEHPKNPVNPYGRSKLTIEAMLGDFGLAHGLRSVALRYFNAAGASASGLIGEAHDPETHLIPNVLRAALRGEAVTVFGDDYATADGSCVRDYVHVSDLCAAHLAALEYLQHDGESIALNLGSECGYSVFEVLAAAEKVCGRPIKRTIAPRRAGDPPTLVASAQRAKQVLHWTPRFSELTTILSSAWAWHLAQSRAAAAP